MKVTREPAPPHDMFAVSFDEIAAILGRSTPAARMLASRARHRIHAAEAPDPDPRRRHTVVEAFLTASRNGDFLALLDVLDPDVTAFAHRAQYAHVVDGGPAILVAPHGRLVTVLTFTIPDRLIVAIDIVADPDRLARAMSRGRPSTS